VAQSFRPPEDPLEDLPEPQPDVQGAANTSLDCSSNVYEKQELLHRPHAFALMHGENGAKVAYGELHWAIDVLIANFKTTTISVNDHCDHSHAPHANHSHSDHTDHSHADHTDHPSHTHGYSHTHTVGVASHDHDHDHTHELNHVHSHSHAHTVNSHSHTITDDIHQGHTGAGTGSSDALFGSGSYNSSDLDEYTHDHGGTTSSETPTTGTPTTINTDQPDDATTDSISSVTTGNVNSGSGTTTTLSQNNTVTEGPNTTLTHSGHSGVKTTSSGGYGAPASDSGILDHSNAVNTDGSALGDDTAGVLKHSGVTATDGTTAPDCVRKHTLTVVEDGDTITESGASVTIDHVDKMGQLPIPDITQQVPNIDTEDGVSMLSEIPNEYFQLTGFGDVYLVWKVDLELAPEVQKCWVQVGEPDTSPISSIGVSSVVTDRLDNDPESSSTEGTYSVKIGTVTEDNKIQQRVSGDVSWRPVVLDRT